LRWRKNTMQNVSKDNTMNAFDKIARTTKPKVKRKVRKPKQKRNIHDTFWLTWIAKTLSGTTKSMTLERIGKQ
jgi:hypothetical protein